MHKLSVVAAALLLAPALSHAKTLDELLVEKGVITKAEASQAASGSAGRAYYNGGTRFEFPDAGFTMKLNTLFQTRYTYTDNDDGIDNTSSFDIKLARLYVSGTALNQEFSYLMNVDFVGSSVDGESSPTLKDGYIAWNICDWAWAKMGQWKTGVGRQFTASDAKLQFADRSIAANEFNLGRQQGAMVGGSQDAWSWSAGVYNGSSTGEGINREGVDTKHAAVANVRWNVMGETDASVEGDVGMNADNALSLGAAYGYSQDEEGGPDDTAVNAISVDASYANQGLSVQAEYFHRNSDDDAVDLSDDGFYVQAGYMMNENWELAARYSRVSPDDASDVDDLNEWTGGLNYYWWAHSLKANINFVHTKEDPTVGDDIKTNEWLLQLSSWF